MLYFYCSILKLLHTESRFSICGSCALEKCSLYKIWMVKSIDTTAVFFFFLITYHKLTGKQRAHVIDGIWIIAPACSKKMRHPYLWLGKYSITIKSSWPLPAKRKPCTLTADIPVDTCSLNKTKCLVSVVFAFITYVNSEAGCETQYTVISCQSQSCVAFICHRTVCKRLLPLSLLENAFDVSRTDTWRKLSPGMLEEDEHWRKGVMSASGEKEKNFPTMTKSWHSVNSLSDLFKEPLPFRTTAGTFEAPRESSFIIGNYNKYALPGSGFTQAKKEITRLPLGVGNRHGHGAGDVQDEWEPRSIFV